MWLRVTAQSNGTSCELVMGRPAAACGTNGGYQRHLRAGESACDECKRAAAAYQRTYNERRKASKHGRAALTVVEPAVPSVRCAVCKAQTPVDAPHEPVDVRIAVVRHLGDPANERCARVRLGGR